MASFFHQFPTSNTFVADTDISGRNTRTTFETYSVRPFFDNRPTQGFDNLYAAPSTSAEEVTDSDSDSDSDSVERGENCENEDGALRDSNEWSRQPFDWIPTNVVEHSQFTTLRPTPTKNLLRRPRTAYDPRLRQYSHSLITTILQESGYDISRRTRNNYSNIICEFLSSSFATETAEDLNADVLRDYLMFKRKAYNTSVKYEILTKKVLAKYVFGIPAPKMPRRVTGTSARPPNRYSRIGFKPEFMRETLQRFFDESRGLTLSGLPSSTSRQIRFASLLVCSALEIALGARGVDIRRLPTEVIERLLRQPGFRYTIATHKGLREPQQIMTNERFIRGSRDPEFILTDRATGGTVDIGTVLVECVEKLKQEYTRASKFLPPRSFRILDWHLTYGHRLTMPFPDTKRCRLIRMVMESVVRDMAPDREPTLELLKLGVVANTWTALYGAFGQHAFRSYAITETYRNASAHTDNEQIRRLIAQRVAGHVNIKETAHYIRLHEASSILTRMRRVQTADAQEDDAVATTSASSGGNDTDITERVVDGELVRFE